MDRCNWCAAPARYEVRNEGHVGDACRRHLATAVDLSLGQDTDHRTIVAALSGREG